MFGTILYSFYGHGQASSSMMDLNSDLLDVCMASGQNEQGVFATFCHAVLYPAQTLGSSLFTNGRWPDGMVLVKSKVCRVLCHRRQPAGMCTTPCVVTAFEQCSMCVRMGGESNMLALFWQLKHHV
jgi:hypothetical protein